MIDAILFFACATALASNWATFRYVHLEREHSKRERS